MTWEYAGTLESHLTLSGINTGNRAQLLALAEAQGLKFLEIVLARGASPLQPMLTHQAQATLTSQLRQVGELQAQLIEHGINVIRVKIEATPGNADIPADASAAAPRPDCYFEHHIKLHLPAGADLPALAAHLDPHQAHLSRNARRQRQDGGQEYFVTQRCHDSGRREAGQALRLLLDSLESAQYVIADIQQEYVVHDSNFALDAGWIADSGKSRGNWEAS